MDKENENWGLRNKVIYHHYPYHLHHIKHYKYLLPENSQSLNVTPDEKGGTIPCSAIAIAVPISLGLQQVNVLE